MHDITAEAIAERLQQAERHYHSENRWGGDVARLLVIYPSTTTPDLVVSWAAPWQWSVFIAADDLQAPGATGDVEHDLALLAQHPEPLGAHLRGHEFIAVALVREWRHEEAGELHDQRCLVASDVLGRRWHLVRDRDDRGAIPRVHMMLDDRGCTLAPALARLGEALAVAYPLAEGR